MSVAPHVLLLTALQTFSPLLTGLQYLPVQRNIFLQNNCDMTAGCLMLIYKGSYPVCCLSCSQKTLLLYPWENHLTSIHGIQQSYTALYTSGGLTCVVFDEALLVSGRENLLRLGGEPVGYRHGRTTAASPCQTPPSSITCTAFWVKLAWKAVKHFG